MKSSPHKLSWGELADVYDSQHTDYKARTLPMGKVSEWAESRPDLFHIDDTGSFHLVENTDER